MLFAFYLGCFNPRVENAMRNCAQIRSLTTILFLAVAGKAALAQGSAPAEGIPIDHKLTIERCGGCHQRDQNGMMGRLSFIRTTPEVWEQAIKRMIRLNGVAASPADVREIVKYLSNNNGLAPEEQETAFWEVDHSLPGHQYDYVPEALGKTCNYCHTIGRVLLQRRTRDDYEKLEAFHIAMFPGSENQFRPGRSRRSSFPTPARIDDSTAAGVVQIAPRPVDMNAPYPIDTIINYLTKNQPLITPEWAAWKAALANPKLAGTWVVSGYQLGKGKAFGTLTVQATSAPDEFTTKLQLYYPAKDVTLTRTGKGIVYTGYSWRGRQKADAAPPPSADPGSNPAEWREAMMVSRDGNSMHGRWFWGGYDEFGIDVTLTRLGSQPIVLGTDLYSLQSPGAGRELRIFGANLPANLKPSDVDLGPGVTVARVIKATPTIATVEVSVAKGLPVGIRNVSISSATAVKALAIYDKIAYIEVSPDASMARLGGGIAAKQYTQLEAIAYAAGPDGKKATADDVSLGPVPARWSLEELYSTPDDDDVKFVGSVNDSGLFTPAIEGPNPARKKASNNFGTNNWGDVWVDAAYDSQGVTLKSRSYLVVTIPQYVRYDQPEVSQ
jgi:quinohemoprotein amine dehydrogenase